MLYLSKQHFHISKIFKIFLFSIFSLYLNLSHAADFECYQGSPVSMSGWVVKNSNELSGIKNGDTIAYNLFYQDFETERVRQGYLLELTAINQAPTISEDSFPLATMPGLGLRWSWQHYENIANAPLDPTPIVSKVINQGIHYIIQNSMFKSSFPGGEVHRNFKFFWYLELVVLDVDAYAGGQIHFNNEPYTSSLNMRAIPSIKESVSSPLNIACEPVLASFSELLGQGGPLSVPPLPKPPTPTCQFPYNELNRSVTLPVIPRGYVPTENDSRESGSIAEQNFTFNAIDCGQDTKFSIFFTDNSLTGSTSNYLSTKGVAGGKVGIRLYVNNNERPITFGPAPTGSNPLLNHAAIQEGPTNSGENFSYNITAQYVRPNGIGIEEINTGNLKAEAAITVIYP